jgi:NAD(P)-dependent dehydrogenase (short-subunit alcohol dehydrogenase family)
MAARGARVVLAIRDEKKGEQAAHLIDGITEVRKHDLASQGSIQAFAEGWNGPIDMLINNAGISSPALQRTADGFELLFGTNHLGPFSLTNLLLPHIAGRVVMVSSQAERTARIDFDDLNWQRTPYNAFRSYANSKLANLLFAMELQRRLNAAGSKAIATAAHPGLVATNNYAQTTGLFARLMVRLAQSDEMGALPVLYAAIANIPGGSFSGPKHFMHMRGAPELIKCSKTALDKKVAKRLWIASEELTGVRFSL